jgi:hypothetical protein
MPQLDKLTYSTQIFWLLLCFSSFYFIILKKILPNILLNIKIREDIIDTSLTGTTNTSVEVKQATNHFIKINNMIVDRVETHVKAIHDSTSRHLSYIPSMVVINIVSDEIYDNLLKSFSTKNLSNVIN